MPRVLPLRRRRRAATERSRSALLVLLAAGAAIMALVRAELGEPLARSVAEWLANHAEQKHDVGDSEGALRNLDRAVAWSDKSPAIYLLRGQILLEKGDLRGSLADFNRLVNLAPKVYQTYLLRAPYCSDSSGMRTPFATHRRPCACGRPLKC